MTKPVVIIPARMGSSRLPGKPLAEIAGAPMIAHVWRRACEANVGPVAVATDSPAIVAAIEALGGRAILTDEAHASGSDRIFEALCAMDPRQSFDAIVNMQGDLPTLAPEFLRAALAPLADPAVDIATLAAEIVRPQERADPNVVKLVGTPVARDRLRALYFTRAAAPWGDGPLFHHIGLYAWRRDALARFVALAPSTLERRERLEQLRALEAGMRIDAILVDAVPLGVDTPEDLERARALIGATK